MPRGGLHLLGRADDMINTGRLQVAPTKVEDAAMAVDAVADCICVAGTIRCWARCPAAGGDARGASPRPHALDQALALQLEPMRCLCNMNRWYAIKRTFNGIARPQAYRERRAAVRLATPSKLRSQFFHTGSMRGVSGRQQVAGCVGHLTRETVPGCWGSMRSRPGRYGFPLLIVVTPRRTMALRMSALSRVE
jgi:acyl-CoA synthetase (AMP-forming)/AMP-acid ligase II